MHKHPLLSDQISNSELNVVLNYAQKALQLDGDFVEFGCYVGTTSVHLQPIALAYNKQLHIYDSFEGLPEKTPKDDSPAGFEFKKGELLASKKQVLLNFKKRNLPPPIIHKAWFSDLTAKDLPQSICFAFLDGDFYQSITDSLQLTWPRLVNGGYILVHDYDRTTLPGSKRAVTEFLHNQPTASLERIQEHIAVLIKR